MSRYRAAVLAVAALVGVPLAVPAEAVASFGSVVRMTPNGCWGPVAVSPTGVTRGFVICSSGGWRYLSGSGSSWSTTSSPFGTGYAVLAVAVDGSTTWFVTTGSGGTHVRKRTSSGYSTVYRLTTSRVERGLVALVAVGGKYHATWSQENGSGGTTLWEAHTLNSVLHSRRFYGSLTSAARDVSLSLAYQPSSRKVVLAWSHQVTSSQQSVLMSYTSGGAWQSPRTVATNAHGASLAVSGSTIAIGYNAMTSDGCGCSGRVAIGTLSGISTRRSLTGQNHGPPKVAISNGVIGAVWQSRTSPYPVRVSTRVSGTWSERTLSSPAPEIRGVQSVASVSGKLRFFARYGYLGVRSQ